MSPDEVKELEDEHRAANEEDARTEEDARARGAEPVSAPEKPVLDELVEKLKNAVRDAIDVERTRQNNVQTGAEPVSAPEKPVLDELVEKLKNAVRDAIDVERTRQNNVQTGAEPVSAPEKPVLDEIRINEKTITKNAEIIEKNRQTRNLISKSNPRQRTFMVDIMSMVEESSQPRPKSSNDPAREASLAEMTAVPPRISSAFRLTPKQLLAARALVAFGHIPTFPFKLTAQGLSLLAKLLATGASKIKTSFDPKTSGLTNSDLATGGTRNAVKTSIGEIVALNVEKGIMRGLDIVMKPLDFLQLFGTFADASFYGTLLDPSQLVTDSTLKDQVQFSITTQVDLMRVLNNNLKTINQTCDPLTDVDCPYHYAQFPAIAGPLDDLGMKEGTDPRLWGDPYFNQTKIRTMVDAIRENMLRDQTQKYYTPLSQAMVQLGYDIQSVTMAPDYSLVGFVSYLSVSLQDDLYDAAYSQVCSYYGGTMYTDYFMMGPMAYNCSHSSNVAGTCQYTTNRPRFQCGYTQSNCNIHANTWSSSSWGHYAEWYSASDISNYMTSTIIDNSDPDLQTPPLIIQQAFTQGACMVTSSGIRTFCVTNNGTYDPTTHKCIFTKEYCQSVGTCYCAGTQTCFLPTTTLEGLSFFMGTGGPREWIKIHGCVSNETTCGAHTITSLSDYRTGDGRRWFSDMFANTKNWGPGLKNSIGNPMGAFMFTGAVLGIVAMLPPVSSAIKTASALIYAASAEAGTATDAAAAGAADVAASAAAAAAAEGASTATLAVGFGVPILMTAVAIAMGIFAGIEAAQAAMAATGIPVSDGNEYTVGGWTLDTTTNTLAPRKLGFADGWVTKPLRMKNSSGSVYSSIGSFPYSSYNGNTTQMSFFDTNATCSKYDSCTLGTDQGVSDIYYAAGQKNTTIGQSKCYQNWGNNNAPYGVKDYSAPSSGGYRIRAGSDAKDNRMWCIPPFPVTSETTYLFDSTVGQLATTSSTTLTNNTWTDGSDWSYPVYPTQAAWHGDPVNSWYYQVVYDKDKLAGAGNITRDDTVNPPVTGCDVTTNPNCMVVGFSLPINLWNTSVLQQNFPDSTIMDMRKYFCGKQLTADITGQTIDPKCWGYLSIMYNSWKLIPMSIPK